MDNGAIPFMLFVFPFWAGLICASLILVILIPIGINVALRIFIDGILAVRRRGRDRAEGRPPRDVSPS